MTILKKGESLQHADTATDDLEASNDASIPLPAQAQPAKRAEYSKWQYAVQLGFFSTEPNAQKLLTLALERGLGDIRIEDTEREGKHFYRVLSGTYQTLTAAREHLSQTIALGFSGAIHRW